MSFRGEASNTCGTKLVIFYCYQLVIFGTGSVLRWYGIEAGNTSLRLPVAELSMGRPSLRGGRGPDLNSERSTHVERRQ
jgi:hypothetical protein